MPDPARRWRIRHLAALLVAAGVLYLLLWPVGIRPQAWNPPVNPGYVGSYALNEHLRGVERLGVGAGVGPESIAIDAEGLLYAGMVDGRIMRFDRNGTSPEVFAETGGRPLGLDFDAHGNLIVADAVKGLLRLATDGSIEVLTTEHDGVAFGFTDDVAVGPSGTIYFTDASDRWGLHNYHIHFLEQAGRGRLLAYDTDSGRTRLFLDGLHFANGVAVAPDESFLLVAETSRYRITRHWLTGPRAGTSDIFIDNLPGFPDNITAAPAPDESDQSDESDESNRVHFWVAVVSPRSPALDWAHPRPWFKKLILRLPPFLRPGPRQHGMVLGLTLDGAVVDVLHDPTGETISMITSVIEHDGHLYLGTLDRDFFGRIERPEMEE